MEALGRGYGLGGAADIWPVCARGLLYAIASLRCSQVFSYRLHGQTSTRPLEDDRSTSAHPRHTPS